MQNIIGLNVPQLKEAFAPLGLEPFRAAQVFQWVYRHGLHDFAGMSNLSEKNRQTLAEHFKIERPAMAKAQVSIDGTQKWLLQFEDANQAEAVHIPEARRGTLCVSSQVGCTLSCKFCHTGTQTLVRNLTAGEIIGQFMVARDVFEEWPTPESDRKVSHIVMMGMGEPLYNYENVKAALKIIMDPNGIALPARKITLSTSGVVPNIVKCGEELGVNLAISLHAVNNELRDKIMPINKKYPLEELLAACRQYPGVTKHHRITFEYVMLRGVNDSPADARQLVKLIKGMAAKVNLIPFNPWPGTDFECSTPQAIQAFSDILEYAGYMSPVRRPRGQDIFAACGQLKSESERISKSKRVGAA
jgi:23S rRNA (adenine2503-C2)-methyltransferase